MKVLIKTLLGDHTSLDGLNPNDTINDIMQKLYKYHPSHHSQSLLFQNTLVQPKKKLNEYHSNDESIFELAISRADNIMIRRVHPGDDITILEIASIQLSILKEHKFSFVVTEEQCQQRKQRITEALQKAVTTSENRMQRSGLWVVELHNETSQRIILGSIGIVQAAHGAGPRAAGGKGTPVTDNDTAELRCFYLKKEYRGRGIGEWMYNIVEKWCGQWEYKKIWLETSRRFVSARKLYNRKDFVLLESIDNVWEDDLMSKNIASIKKTMSPHSKKRKITSSIFATSNP